jgi:hypothetical protein
MVDFTTLMNRGHRRFIAYKKKRQFGSCEDCEIFALLLEYQDPEDTTDKWLVCEHCYRKLQLDEE